jgi:hypothetical protein
LKKEKLGSLKDERLTAWRKTKTGGQSIQEFEEYN